MLFKYNPFLTDIEKDFSEETDKITKQIDFLVSCSKSQGFDQEEDFIFLPDHKNDLNKLEEYSNKALDLGFDFIIFVGIGGANLGVMTVCNALSPDKEIFFLENIDPDYNSEVFTKIKREYDNGRRAVFITASKSGMTSETMSNFVTTLALFKELEKDWQKRSFVTTVEGSPLEEIAKREQLNILHTNELLVDRYSVFGIGSLFALQLAGVNVSQLLSGAQEITNSLLNTNLSKNPAAQSALDIFHNLQNDKPIHNTFIFSQKLETFGRWQRQLIGESLGKDGKGVVPMYSVGTTDLHSMTQLYLDGKKNIFTTFITLENFHNDIDTDRYHLLAGTALEKISNKTYAELLSIIVTSVKKAYDKQQRPFAEVILGNLTESTLGALLQTNMLTVVFLSTLMEVNPFNQDAVEIYKEEIRKLV